MTNFASPELFAAAAKSNLESAVTLANTSFARVERLSALNLNTARATLEDSIAATKTLLAVKDPQELVKLQAELAKPMQEKAVAYGRSVYAIISEGQQEFVKFFEAQVAEMNSKFLAALDQAAKSAPAGSEAAFAAIKQGVAAANSAYDNVSRAAKQAVETAEANVVATTESAVKSVRTRKAA